MDEHTKRCIGLNSGGLYKKGVIDGRHLESFWRLIAERLPAPLVHEHQHCRHCKLPLSVFLSQLSLTVIQRCAAVYMDDEAAC